MGLGSFIQSKSAKDELVPAAPAATPGQAPGSRQIYKNRLNKGVNFGGLFVLEKWISPHMFPANLPGGKTAELDAVHGLLKESGNDFTKVRQQFEHHWQNFITDDDWNYLKSVGVTAVRVPIGYWNVAGGQYTSGTSFQGLGEIYKNSWSILKSNIIEKAHQYQIGILVDLHGVPGGANTADHSGVSDSPGELWSSNKCQVQTWDVLEYISKDLKQYENIVGIQVVNEAPWANDWKSQQSFYLKSLYRIRESDNEQPVVVSDGWDLNAWSEWCKSRTDKLCKSCGVCDGAASLGLILDEHVYRTFSDKDRNTAPRQLIDGLDGALSQDPFEVDVQIGEFSCVMDTNSWKLNDQQGGGDRGQLVSEFGNKQCQMYNQKAAAYYFWTYKFQEGSGGEWGFREMQQNGCLNAGFAPLDHQFPSNRNVDDSFYNHQFEQRFNNAFNGHKHYWESQDPKRDWQHGRFEDGYKTAWADALAFDQFGHSTIGRRAAWLAARLHEHDQKFKGSKDMEWVYKEGFKQGLQGFLEARYQGFHG